MQSGVAVVFFSSVRSARLAAHGCTFHEKIPGWHAGLLGPDVRFANVTELQTLAGQGAVCSHSWNDATSVGLGHYRQARRDRGLLPLSDGTQRLDSLRTASSSTHEAK